MSKSVLIIGAGRYGYYSAMKLHELGHDVMIVDQDEEKINKVMPYVSDARIGDSVEKSFLWESPVSISASLRSEMIS